VHPLKQQQYYNPVALPAMGH